jgi:hypothetical protein
LISIEGGAKSINWQGPILASKQVRGFAISPPKILIFGRVHSQKNLLKNKLVGTLGEHPLALQSIPSFRISTILTNFIIMINPAFVFLDGILDQLVIACVLQFSSTQL